MCLPLALVLRPAASARRAPAAPTPQNPLPPTGSKPRNMDSTSTASSSSSSPCKQMHNSSCKACPSHSRRDTCMPVWAWHGAAHIPPAVLHTATRSSSTRCVGYVKSSSYTSSSSSMNSNGAEQQGLDCTNPAGGLGPATPRGQRRLHRALAAEAAVAGPRSATPGLPLSYAAGAASAGPRRCPCWVWACMGDPWL